MTEFVKMGSGFTKEALDVLQELSELAEQVKSHHGVVQAAAGKAVVHARLAGEALIVAKAKVPHGNWRPWIEQHCQISQRTAQVYMQVARGMLDPHKAQRAALLPIRGALNLIAEPRPAKVITVLSHDAEPSEKTVTVRYHESDEPLFHVPPFYEKKDDEDIRPTVVTVPDKREQSVHFSSRTPEHYTPEVILDAVLACMGEIDLDPCSNPGESNVPATSHYTEQDDGLEQEWRGRVFINPPYGRAIGPWVRKLRYEHEVGTVTQAIALVPSRTDTEWFRVLQDYPVCFISGRLTFGGNSDPAPFPSAVFYLGDRIDAFRAAFGHLGGIWMRLRD